jgi:hypothetical protein
LFSSFSQSQAFDPKPIPRPVKRSLATLKDIASSTRGLSPTKGTQPRSYLFSSFITQFYMQLYLSRTCQCRCLKPFPWCPPCMLIATPSWSLVNRYARQDLCRARATLSCAIGLLWAKLSVHDKNCFVYSACINVHVIPQSFCTPEKD